MITKHVLNPFQSIGTRDSEESIHQKLDVLKNRIEIEHPYTVHDTKFHPNLNHYEICIQSMYIYWKGLKCEI